ncbi:MAG: hypothetical protein NC923_04500 [Candidatus Omnitrophica bacterium]|nr:hypothetical protein [Candidatus Omnitrophota bacterium]
MFTFLRKTISLSNLRCGCVLGQISTLLIFMMVIILAMILVTVNLGQLTNFALDLSNAADFSVLIITNSIATHMHILWEAMGKKDKICQLGGIFELILFFILFIPSLLLFGTGLTGIIIATKIGGLGLSLARGIYYGSFNAALSGFLDGLIFGVTVGSGFMLGTFATLLAFTSATANWVIKSEMSAEAIEEAAKQLNGLSQEDSIAQSAVYTAFLNTVNDPSKIQDYYDSDADGNYTEMVPYFQFWWARRIQYVKRRYGANSTAVKNAIDNFKNNAVLPFLNYLNSVLANGGLFSRQEIEGSDGPLVALLRATKKAAGEPHIKFWSPGPNKENYECWQKYGCFPDPDTAECAGCMSLCTGYLPGCIDDVDKVILFLTVVRNELQQFYEKDIAILSDTWYIWLPIFWAPESEGESYYQHLLKLINGDSKISGVKEWQRAIENKRISLETCKLGCIGGYCFLSPTPCRGPAPYSGCDTYCGGTKIPPHNPDFGSINADIYDEFKLVQNSLQELIDRIGYGDSPPENSFRGACKKLYDALTSIKFLDTNLNIVDAWLDPSGIEHKIDYGGDGRRHPAVYWWCDSTGYHEIRVQVDFVMPRIKKSSSFIETCVYIVNKISTPSVVIERLEPKSNMGVLGTWNPLLSSSATSRVRDSLSPVAAHTDLITERCGNCSKTHWCDAQMFSIKKTGKGCAGRTRTGDFVSQIYAGGCN